MGTWKLGSRHPETHPLWSRQVELELRMVERGADRYRAKVAKAKDKGEMTALRPYRRILEDMVDVMGQGLRSWIAGVDRASRSTSRKINPKVGRAPRGICFDKIHKLDPFVVAFVTARSVLDGITLNNTSMVSTARRIGTQVEYEARMASWFARDPGLFKKVQHDLTAQKATAQHRKRVNINRFNKLLKVKHRWRDWTHDERLHTGLRLLEILSKVTGHINFVPDPNFKRNGIKSAPYIVVPSQELLEYLEETTSNDEERSPLYLPCLMPPKRWEGVRQGGYYTPLVRLPRLIRFKADNEEVQGVAADEYDSLDMPEVFSALDKVQEVPWRVNKRVLAVAFQAWERNLGIGKLEKREEGRIGKNGKLVPDDMPPVHPGQRRDDLKGQERRDAEQAWRKKHPKLFQEWKRAAARRYGSFARSLSNKFSVQTTLQIAEMFRDEEFYFPHMLDFRGRMYPIPAYLQPQGNDLARGFLTFAHGAPVGPGGDDWLGIHLANCWGNDKISFDERVAWARNNWDLWVRIYENPLGNLEWAHQADDPWQTLAAIFEFVRVCSSDDPAGMVSSLPLRVDGTCNGIQHLSAMMRDSVGGASVNLLPGGAPRDIYGEAGKILEEKLRGIREAGGKQGAMAAMWLEAFGPGGVPRKFTKGPVMVTPYGGTRDSFKGSVMEWLQKNDPKAIPDKKGEKFNARFEATLWIVPHLWDSVAERVVEGRKCMEWLKGCARLVADAGQPIWWTTSVGFHVRHFYGRIKKRQVTTLVDGKRVDIVDYVRTKELSKKDQLQGIAPNFVHSMDGAVNMETILEFMQGDDPPPFTTIHDAFGTVAGAMWPLYGAIRESFIKIHREDVMRQFRVQCVHMLKGHLLATNKKGWDMETCWEEAESLMPKMPTKGDLDIEEVRHAEYFFA